MKYSIEKGTMTIFYFICCVFFAYLLVTSTGDSSLWRYAGQSRLFYSVVYAIKPLVLTLILGSAYVFLQKINLRIRIQRGFAVIGNIVQLLIIGHAGTLPYYPPTIDALYAQMSVYRSLAIGGCVIGYMFGWALVRFVSTLTNWDMGKLDKYVQKISTYSILIYIAGASSSVIPRMIAPSECESVRCAGLLSTAVTYSNMILVLGAWCESFLFLLLSFAFFQLFKNSELEKKMVTRRISGIIVAFILAYITNWHASMPWIGPGVDFSRFFWAGISFLSVPVGYLAGYLFGFLIGKVYGSDSVIRNGVA